MSLFEKFLKSFITKNKKIKIRILTYIILRGEEEPQEPKKGFRQI